MFESVECRLSRSAVARAAFPLRLALCLVVGCLVGGALGACAAWRSPDPLSVQSLTGRCPAGFPIPGQTLPKPGIYWLPGDPGADNPNVICYRDEALVRSVGMVRDRLVTVGPFPAVLPEPTPIP